MTKDELEAGLNRMTFRITATFGAMLLFAFGLLGFLLVISH
jgi:hypothetical protein